MTTVRDCVVRRGRVTHLWSVAAPTRLTWCGLWVMTPSETRIPPVVEVMSGDEDVLILERVTTTMVVCDACAERALRAVAADYERLRALKRNG